MSPFQPLDARARIIGGTIANKRNWPWAVRIFDEGWSKI